MKVERTSLTNWSATNRTELIAVLSNLPTTGMTKNIGDYIQILSALQFAKPDFFIDRERLADYDGIPARILLNGWFMHDCSKFPPSNKIDPLFVSFHISQKSESALLTSTNVEYFKQHEPIGCRDRHTKRLLEDNGVKAYYSACLTLTLGRSFHRIGGGKILFVDPYLPWGWMSLREMVNLKGLLPYIIRHLFTAITFFVGKKLDVYNLHHDIRGWRKIILDFLIHAAFLKEYQKIIPLSELLTADYLSNIVTLCDRNGDVNQAFLEKAKQYMSKYASAKAVITSRIHCALPCVAIDTPVTFVKGDTSRDRSFIWNLDNGRLDGPMDFFNCVSFENGILLPDSLVRPVADWRTFALKLSDCVEKFYGLND